MPPVVKVKTVEVGLEDLLNIIPRGRVTGRDYFVSVEPVRIALTRMVDAPERAQYEFEITQSGIQITAYWMELTK